MSDGKKLLICAIGVVFAGVIAVVLLLFNGGLLEKDITDLDENAAEWAVDDSRSYEGIFVHDGNYETLQKLHAFVQEYFDFYQRGNIKMMYEGYWDSTAMRALGYEYTEEDFSSDIINAGVANHIFNNDKNKVDFSYTAVTYEDYTNFYKYTFKLQYTYKDDEGKVVQTPIAEYTYTIIPYTNENGVYYRLLDFDISDIDMQGSRFQKIGEEKETEEDTAVYDNVGRGGI